MATATINYGTRAEYPSDAANLSGLAAGSAVCVGAVDNSSVKAVGFKIDATIYLATTGVTSSGTLTFYLVESADGGTSYTDGINVTTTSVATSSIKNAPVVYTANANANGQVVRVVFDLPEVYAPKSHSLLILNGSGAALPSSTASTCTVFSTPITYNIA